MFPPRKRPLYPSNIEFLYVESCPREGNKRIRLEELSDSTGGQQNYTPRGKPHQQQQPCPRCLAGESGHFKHV
uniref:Uncharacterized protein n=1 Tax=Strongyloides papillosus TaxID=174720 RepID=A0A0N5B8Y3_STREA